MKPLNYKRIALIIAVIVSSTAIWAISRAWLDTTDRFSNLLGMLWPALAVVVAGAVTVVALMLMEHAWDRVAATVASWATFTFFWQPDVWYLSALPVFFVLWWVASQQMRHDLTDRRTIRVSTTLGQGMSLILLGWFLMVSVGFYLLPTNRPTLTTVSKSIQQSVTDSAFVRQQLPPGSQVQFSQYIDSTVRTWLGPVRQFIPPILAFGLFLTLCSLNFLLRPLAVWLGSQLVRLLRLLGFVHIQEQDVTAEVLSI